MQPIAIIDRGRGPEIAGTRTTVYDILPYLEMGWHPSSIASLFNLSAGEVAAAAEYYRTHEAEMEKKQHPANGKPLSPTRVLALRVHV
jgi:uncharacterized protein (DUF433 family)